MGKKKMLYASPFPPQKSGIADYSVVLAKALSVKYEMTILVSGENAPEQSSFSWAELKNYDNDIIDFNEYDYRIYNIGNHPDFHGYIYEICLRYPGLIILHDFVLYYLFVGYHQKKSDLCSKAYMECGRETLEVIKHAVRYNDSDLLEQKDLAAIVPCNLELLRSDNQFMLHSWYSYNKVLETGLVREESMVKINHVALTDDEDRILERGSLLQKYNIPSDAFLISSMGYVAETKLNREICKVVKKINEVSEKKICYVMVGEGDYIDSYIDNEIIFKTGYVQLDEFNSFIDHSDIIMNLRHPSMGETSGALIRVLQKGKLCFVNNEGWFSEIPDDCAIKVEFEAMEKDLYSKLYFYVNNPDKRKLVGCNARKYINSEFSAQSIVEQISHFLEKSLQSND